MNDRAYVAVTRRGSLLTLGRAAFAAAVPSAAARAGQSKKKARRKASNRCPRQIPGCRTAILAVCELEPASRCQEAADCCSSLATCDVAAFFACLVEVSEVPS